jgi:hypothetical protein
MGETYGLLSTSLTTDLVISTSSSSAEMRRRNLRFDSLGVITSIMQGPEDTRT